MIGIQQFHNFTNGWCCGWQVKIKIDISDFALMNKALLTFWIGKSVCVFLVWYLRCFFRGEGFVMKWCIYNLYLDEFGTILGSKFVIFNKLAHSGSLFYKILNTLTISNIFFKFHILFSRSLWLKISLKKIFEQFP